MAYFETKKIIFLKIICNQLLLMQLMFLTNVIQYISSITRNDSQKHFASFQIINIPQL